MLLFCDGFSYYDVSYLGRKWNKTDDNVVWDVTNVGRTDGAVTRANTNNNSLTGYLEFSPIKTQNGTWSPQRSGVCGFALRIDDLSKLTGTPGSGGSYFSVNTLLNVMNANWTMFHCTINPTGTITVYQYRFSGGAQIPLVTTIEAIRNNEWAFLEFKWTLSTSSSNTDGSLVIRSNGVIILNYTGILFPDNFPAPAPSALWTTVRVLGLSSSAISPFLNMRMCDFYLLDTVASADPSNPNNDFLGDITISYIKPDNNGSVNDWTPLSGANWQNVSEIPPDGDTSYVSATAPNSRDNYVFTTTSATNILGLQQSQLLRKVDDGAATIKPVYRLATTNYDGIEAAVASTTNYSFILSPYDVNPSNDLKFTQSDINNGQFGIIKVT